MLDNRVYTIRIILLIIVIACLTIACQFKGVIPTFNIVRDKVIEVLPAGKLDPETLEELTILWPGDMQMKPGAEQQLKVGIIECCYVFTPIKTRVVWSIEPSQGVTIDPESGLLTLDSAVEHGAQFVVTANIEKGRKLLEKKIFVFTEEGNPFAGNWREKAQISCQDGSEYEPEEPIGEVTFNAAGKMSVTWHPFEIYHDYWATYNYDLKLGSIEISEFDGGYIPPEMDPSGYFEFDTNGDLILKDIWLGAPRDNPVTTACGHRLSR